MKLEPGTKWYDNPQHVLMALITKARKTVINSSILISAESCQNVITMNVAKLVATPKPPLEDSLGYLASIIALQDYAQTKGWEMGGKEMLGLNWIFV